MTMLQSTELALMLLPGSKIWTPVGCNDEVWLDDDGNGPLDCDDVSIQNIPNSLTYAFPGDHVGSLFGFGADDFRHDFTLKSVPVEAVPVPDALTLFSSL